jgi:hypothetical protein
MREREESKWREMIGETNKNDGKGIQEKRDKDLFFIYGLLKNVARHSQYVALTGRIISEKYTQKDMEVSSSVVLTRLSGPRSRPPTSQKIW